MNSRRKTAGTKKNKPEPSAIETIISEVVLDEKSLSKVTERIQRQDEQIKIVKDEHIPSLLASKGIIAKTTEEISSSTKKLINLVPKAANAAQQLTSIIAEEEELCSETLEKIVKNGVTLAEESDMALGYHKNHVKHLETSFKEERRINNERIAGKLQDIDAEEAIVKREHSITMAKFRNAEFRKRLQFGNLEDRLAELAEAKKNQKATETEKSRKKGFWDFWWFWIFLGIIVGVIILFISTILINNGTI